MIDKKHETLIGCIRNQLDWLDYEHSESISDEKIIEIALEVFHKKLTDSAEYYFRLPVKNIHGVIE